MIKTNMVNKTENVVEINGVKQPGRAFQVNTSWRIFCDGYILKNRYEFSL